MIYHGNGVFMMIFWSFKYLVVPIIIIFLRMELKWPPEERAMVLVGGCAIPNFRTTTEIRVSQGNCCDSSLLFGPGQELLKHSILLIF